MAASSPSWRASAPRAVRRSSRNRSSSRLAISATGSVLVRAAASSMASGRPSRWRTSSGDRPGPARRRWRSAAAPRWPARRTASTRSASSSGSSGTWCSPSTDSGSRLVARIRTLGQPCSSATTSVGRGVGDVLAVVEDHDGVAIGEPLDRPLRRRRCGPTRVGGPLRGTDAGGDRRRRRRPPSTSGASSTNHTSRSLAMRWASSSVRRDLPTPPGPTTVTRRARPSVATTSVSSRAAPDERRQRDGQRRLHDRRARRPRSARRGPGPAPAPPARGPAAPARDRGPSSSSRWSRASR